MSRPVISIAPDTTVREAITLLTEKGFSAVPVVDEGGRVIGIFSESDALRATTHGIDHRMLAGRLRCVPVVAEGLLVGVVARRDLLRTLVRDDDVIAANVRTSAVPGPRSSIFAALVAA